MTPKHIEELLSRDLDGALAPEERSVLQAAEAADPALAELRHTWQRCGSELHSSSLPGLPTPEAAWADVQRAIRLAGSEDGRAREISGWRMVWVASSIVLLLAGSFFYGVVRPPEAKVALLAPPTVEVEFVETDLPGASTLVYQDEETGWALVWVSEDQPGETPRGT